MTILMQASKLQHVTKNTKTRRRIACSQGQPLYPYYFQKMQYLLPTDYLPLKQFTRW